LVYSYKILQTYHTGKSKFQTVEVMETAPFGRVLITDGLLQSSETDEYVYHECLVHPALIAHGNPKRVYIGGGGEGATLRECLKYPSVEQVVMVDIDGEVVDMCTEHMKAHGADAWKDPRSKVIIDDAKAQLELTPDGHYDVIVLDLSDPLDGGPCYQLYTAEFYTMCKNKLSEKGVLITQSGSSSIREVQHGAADGVFSPVHNTLKQVFPKVFGATAYVPSFCSEWGWNLACKDPNAEDILKLDIDARIQAAKVTNLKYYDQSSHTRMFNLPKPVKAVVDAEQRVMTVANPLFMNHVSQGVCAH